MPVQEGEFYSTDATHKEHKQQDLNYVEKRARSCCSSRYLKAAEGGQGVKRGKRCREKSGTSEGGGDKGVLFVLDNNWKKEADGQRGR